MLRGFRPGSALGLAYLGFVSLGVRSSLLGITWPSIRADFDVPLDALGALIGPSAAGYLVGSFVSGRALARWRLGVLLAAAFAGLAISLVGSAVAPTWWLLLLLGIPGGLGAGLVDAGLNTYVANRQGPRQVNWLHASWGIGATLSPFVVSAALSAGFGWRLGYLVTGLLLLALGAAYLVTRAAWPSRSQIVHQHPPDFAHRGATMWQTLRLPAAWLSMLLFIVYTGVELSIGQWAFPLLVSARGLGTVEAGAAVSAYWAGLTLGRLFFGGIVATIGVERLLQACLLTVLVGLGLLWAPASPGMAFAAPSLAFVALGLLGVAQAPVYPALIALTPSHFGSAHTANAVGFQVAASVIGGAGLPALIGVFAQAFGLETIVPTLLAAALLQMCCYVAWSR